jgi:biotin operon repressor
MEMREGQIRSIKDLIVEKNIELSTLDPIARFGFTQLPNFVLKNSSLSIGSKVVYAMFLYYAWHKDSCFPGQDRLAVDIGMSKSRVNEFIKELERAGLVEIHRRGQGKTNIYRIKFVIKKKTSRRDS